MLKNYDSLHNNHWFLIFSLQLLISGSRVRFPDGAFFYCIISSYKIPSLDCWYLYALEMTGGCFVIGNLREIWFHS